MSASRLYATLDKLTGNLAAFHLMKKSMSWMEDDSDREILALCCRDAMGTEGCGYLNLMLRAFDGADHQYLKHRYGVTIKVDLCNGIATPERWGNGATADPDEAGMIASAIDECVDRCESVGGITKISDIWDTSSDEMRRILQAGYPSILYHGPEGDSPGRIEWWAEDDRGYDLWAAFNSAMDVGSEAETDLAQKRLIDHWDDVEGRTIAALRQQANVNDLCNLIDAAAKQGEALCPDNAAGWFLRRIAELAMAEITR